MKRFIVILIIITSTSFHLYSQSVGIAAEEFKPHNSAALEIKTTSKGLLIPRMTLAQRMDITNPATGLLVYQLDGSIGFYYYDTNTWYYLKDSRNDQDDDPSNEIQTISLFGNTLSLTQGGSIILPPGSESTDYQTLSLKNDTLFIENGNYVLLESVKDDLGNHLAEMNIRTQNFYLTSDGDDEGILINPSGDISLSNDIYVAGTVNSENLTTNGAVNLGNNAIQASEIEDEAITTSKIGDSQITGEKIHPMGAGIDQFLQFDGTAWKPADIAGGLSYQGAWDASQNLPVIADNLGVNGEYYVVSSAGSQNLGSSLISFAIGDWAIYNGNIWQKITNSSDVNSVFGRTGTILAQFGDYDWDLIDKTNSSINDVTDVNSQLASSGQLLVSNGSQWVNTSISGDLSINSSGNAQINPASILYNDLRNATNGINSILVWDGGAWVEESFQNLEGDASSTNEFQDLSLSLNSLGLTNSIETINLAPYLDNTDSQSLSFTTPTLSISGGNSVDLSALSGSGTDNQELNLVDNNLSIEDGNSVSLASYLDNTDNQDLSISVNTLSLTNGATTIDLTSYLDNTDSQTLSFASPFLSISGGSPVDLSELTGSGTDDQELSLSGTDISIEDGNNISLAAFMDNTDNQGLSISGNTLEIENGSGVSMAPFMDNTDSQTLDFSDNPLLRISGGSSFVNLETLVITSDIRLKENISATKFGIEDVLKIKVYDYDFISGASNQTGLIAQDLYKIYPSVVKVGGENVQDDPWGIRYNMLTPLLTKSIQDIYFQVIDLKESNQKLIEENKRIKQELNLLISYEERIVELEKKLIEVLQNAE